MACADALKILFGAYMMSEEVKYWWDNSRHKFEANDNRASSSHYKSVSDKRSGNQKRGKPYVVLNGKGKHKFQHNNNGGRSHSGGGAHAHLKYFKCGVLGHHAVECSTLICFLCGKAGHIDNECKNIVILCLMVSAMNDIMVNDTPVNGLVTTSSVCLKFPLTIYGRNFGVDLVFLSLSQLHVILGMHWVDFNYMYINRYNKTILFPEFVEEKRLQFIFAR
ncbi:uncharacterized protein LOC127101999 [Lathyrus oleraceus]|uniref:uncharacterized protein LOC127101999 n=1 Tax=Pisum sativum TaxID=3888 RepID=UPI0021CE874C|nr:uncharacterized protein LOC127101999 [Pisum sativum]